VGDDRYLPFDTSSIDFVFVGRALVAAKHPTDLAIEAAWILKPEGHLVMLTSSAADAYRLRSIQALLPSLRLVRSREIDSQDDDSSTLQELTLLQVSNTVLWHLEYNSSANMY
jgi:ubiquinone/menaquinone biosynthesis C-methylase UbiE